MNGDTVSGLHPFLRLLARLAGPAGDDRAAQLVEFAVALPLLVVFVVGIFDFSNAFTLKEKLTNVARDAARAAASNPASDLNSPAPVSVTNAFQDVDKYLLANNMSDCNAVLTSSSTATLTWTYSGTTGCPGTGLVVIINRGYYFTAAAATQPANVNCQPPAISGGPTQIAVIGTCVSIQYAYAWQFGRAASLLGTSATLPSQITAAAVAMNEN